MQTLTSFPLGRRSRWLVIGTWVLLAVALAGLQPKLQAKAADESETFRARGAESTTVHHLLDSRFREIGALDQAGLDGWQVPDDSVVADPREPHLRLDGARVFTHEDYGRLR